MQGILSTAQAAFTLLVVLFVGWGLVFLAAYYMERRLYRGKSAGVTAWNSFAWVWDNANLIGIPTLIIGAVYMVWAQNYGPGLMGGPSPLVLLLMAAAAGLIGFAPSMRRLRRP